MSRLFVAVVVAAVAVAGCQPAAKGPSAAEKRLAEKIVDTGIIVPVDEQGFRQIAMQQVQGMMQQDGLSPEVARQVMLGVVKNLEESKDEIRQDMVTALTDEFNVKEMELLLKFVNSKEGKAINEKMPVVGQKGGEMFRARSQEAATKALAELRGAWPTPLPAPPAAPEPQGIPGFPGGPPADGAPVAPTPLPN